MLPKMTNVGWSDGDVGQISNMLTDKVSENDKSQKLLEWNIVQKELDARLDVI